MNTDKAIMQGLISSCYLVPCLACNSELFSCYGDNNDKGWLEEDSILFGIFFLKGENTFRIALLKKILGYIHFD